MGGKSDIKTVAVKDNEGIVSSETEWDVTNVDPQYHWDKILGVMKETASKLEKVEAIGGSTTGTIDGDNGATWCDIFPNVPPDVYQEKVVPIFRNLACECEGKGCMWCPSYAEGDPWCIEIFSTGGDGGSDGSPTCGVSDSSKQDCGFLGIDQSGCESQGCCWAESNTNGIP